MACFYATISGNTLTLKQIFWKTKTFFKKFQYHFLVKSTKIENTSFPYKNVMSELFWTVSCPEGCACIMILRRWHRWWCKLWCGTHNIMKTCSVLNQMLKKGSLIKKVYLKSRCSWELFIDDGNILAISSPCFQFFSASSFLNSKNAQSLSFSNSYLPLVHLKLDSVNARHFFS